MHPFVKYFTLLLGYMLGSVPLVMGQFTLQNGAVLHTSGPVVIGLKDIDLVNNGSLDFGSSSSKVVFSGTANNTIYGSSPMLFDTLEIAKTGSAGIALSQNITVGNGVYFTSGIIDLNGHNIILQPAAALNGESQYSYAEGSNGGYIEASSDLNAPSQANPGNLGAIISSTADLGSTIVRRGHLAQVNGSTIGSSIFRYYDIVPANDAGLNATLRLNYLNTELNGLDKGNFVIWKSIDSTHWTNAGFDSRDSSADYVEKTAIGSFSRWTIAPFSHPLPILLSSATVECLGSAAYVQWRTDMERNSSRFEVQKTMDGRSWMTIAVLPAAGSSEIVKKYSYMDPDPSVGAAFYRIVEYDLDGAATYSPVMASACGQMTNEIKAFPNPVRESLWIALDRPVSSSVNIELISAQGAVLRTLVSTPETGFTYRVDMRGLSAGVYFVKLRWDNGNHTRVFRIMKVSSE